MKPAQDLEAFARALADIQVAIGDFLDSSPWTALSVDHVVSLMYSLGGFAICLESTSEALKVFLDACHRAGLMDRPN